MKIRSGFVSNSSSSSFVCSGCFEVESPGFEGGLSDCDMIACEYCDEPVHYDCIVKPDNFDEILDKLKEEYIDYYKKKIEQNDYGYFGSKKSCEASIERIKKIDNISFVDMIPKELCPSCSMSSIDDSTVLNYLLKKYNHKREEVCDMIRQERK